MAFLRSVTTTTTTAVAASALPAAFALSSYCSQSSHSNPKSNSLSFFSVSSSFLRPPLRLGLFKNLAQPPSAVSMDTPTSDHKSTYQVPNLIFRKTQSCPELLTEFMVDMKCESCVSAVKNKLQTVNGVKNLEVDLSNQVVRVLGTSPVKTMTEALHQTGRNARLIGQGVPEVSAAVAEFKGPDIFGVVLFAQVNMELSRIEASFSGLPPGRHGWSINELGDLTRGAASTGKAYNPSTNGAEEKPLGDLRTLEVNEKEEAFFSGVKEKLRVIELIGRSVAVYGTEDKSDSGLAAAVIARSAGVGENYKKICTCDGTTIWESSDKDFVTSKV